MSNRFDIFDNEDKLMKVNHLLSLGLSPEEMVHHFRPIAGPERPDGINLEHYYEAYLNGIHPQELNHAIDSLDLKETRSRIATDPHTYTDHPEIVHGGIGDWISARKSGATHQEISSALSHLDRVDNEIMNRSGSEIPPAQNYRTLIKKAPFYIRKKLGLHTRNLEASDASTLDTGLENQSNSEGTFYYDPTAAKRGRPKKEKEDYTTTDEDDYSPRSRLDEDSEDRSLDSATREGLLDHFRNTMHEAKEEDYTPSKQAISLSYEELQDLNEGIESLNRAPLAVKEHPLRTYATFRSTPGTTHQEFGDAVKVAVKKWSGLADRSHADSSVPNILNSITSLRKLGYSHEKSLAFVAHLSVTPEVLDIVRNQSILFPKDHLPKLLKLSATESGQLDTDKMRQYYTLRQQQGKNHLEATSEYFLNQLLLKSNIESVDNDSRQQLDQLQ